MTRALVTGANGFIGANVVRVLLDEGVSVRTLTRVSSDTHTLDGLTLERAEGDLRDAASITRAMAGVDVLFPHRRAIRARPPRRAGADGRERGGHTHGYMGGAACGRITGGAYLVGGGGGTCARGRDPGGRVGLGGCPAFCWAVRGQ